MALVPVETRFENTRMEAFYNSNNVLKSFYIYPLEGYALHDNAYDEDVFDEEGNPTGEKIQKFTTAYTSVWHTYDFEANPDNIFAIPLSEIDENQICGGGNNDAEIMSDNEKNNAEEA